MTKRLYVQLEKSRPIHAFKVSYIQHGYTVLETLCNHLTYSDSCYRRFYAPEADFERIVDCKICLRKMRKYLGQRYTARNEAYEAYLKNEQAELCRLTQWKDQIDFNLITCAEFSLISAKPP